MSTTTAVFELLLHSFLVSCMRLAQCTWRTPVHDVAPHAMLVGVISTHPQMLRATAFHHVNFV